MLWWWGGATAVNVTVNVLTIYSSSTQYYNITISVRPAPVSVEMVMHGNICIIRNVGTSLVGGTPYAVCILYRPCTPVSTRACGGAVLGIRRNKISNTTLTQ